MLAESAARGERPGQGHGEPALPLAVIKPRAGFQILDLCAASLLPSEN